MADSPTDDDTSPSAHPTGDERRLILHPKSGNGRHAALVRDLADANGFDVRETAEAGDAIEFAAEAVDDGVSLLAACGGDGTINEVIRGIDRADGFDDVTFAVVPCGTGNNFASNIGVTGVEDAFAVAVEGERRRIDLGTAATPDGDARPFVNSCIAGLTAEASAATEPAAKERLGVVAYVVETLRRAPTFDGLPLYVETAGKTAWSGDAVLVLVGNARRFPTAGRRQANVEDGRLDVTIVENRPPTDLASKALLRRLFGDESSGVTRLTVPSLSLSVREEEAQFSLDGEFVTADELTVETRPRTLSVCVGEEYEPNPE